MAFKFEELTVWKVSLELGERINILANQFPPIEIYNLGSQMRRAADSISLNIAEGSTGHSNGEQKRFLLFANRSLLEVVACLIKAKRRNYIDALTYQLLYVECEKLSKMLNAFSRALN